MKLISIIVPVYNVEKYLPQCIDSLINQTYKNLEIILVDDGSTDSSGIICDNYSRIDSRIKVIHKTNGGQGSARNAALDVAKGEYIGFVDSDDWVKNDMYESLYTAIKKYDADISACGQYDVEYSRSVMMRVSDTIQLMDTSEALKSYFTYTLLATAVWDKLYKRELWSEIRFPQVFREDIFVTYKIIANAKKIVHIGDAKYFYRIRNNSSEHTKYSEKFYNSVKSLDIQYDELKDIFPELIDIMMDCRISQRKLQMCQIVASKSVKRYQELFEEMLLFLEQNKEDRPYIISFVDEIKNHKSRFYLRIYIKYRLIPKYKNFAKFLLSKIGYYRLPTDM